MTPISYWLTAACGLCLVAASGDNDILPEWTFNLIGSRIDWPKPAPGNVHTTPSRYVPSNVIATRLQVWRDTAILATPRYKGGVPFSLARLSLRTAAKCSPLLQPFPSWSLQKEGDCSALQNAVDLFLDAQDILWVLDVGVVNTLEQRPIKHCPPKVVAIEMKSGKVVKVIDLSTLVCERSRLQYLVVDHDDTGRAFVYVSDAQTRAILVWDVTAAQGYRVVLPQAVVPPSGRRDVLYLALVRKADATSVLYFTYQASERVFSIRTAGLRRGSTDSVVVDVGTSGNPVVLLGTDNGLNLFFRYKGHAAIYMWNTDTSFKPYNFLLVQQDDDSRLATQVVPGYKKLIWVLESNFHDYLEGTTGCLGASVILHPLLDSCS